MLKTCSILIVSLAMGLFAARPLPAATDSWKQTNISATATFNLNDTNFWSSSTLPTNGDNVVMVWTTAASGNKTQTVTNAPSATFFADSPSLTNADGSSGGDVIVTFSSQVFLTNGVGQLNFGGVSGNSGNITLTFNSNLTFNTATFIGNGGSSAGTAKLNLKNVTRGSTLVFAGNGTAGANRLSVSGPLNLSGTLIVTNLNAISSGILSSNSTLNAILINNAGNNNFTNSGAMTITGSVASVAGGFTLANTGIINLNGAGGLIFSNVAPNLLGTINVNSSQLIGSNTWVNNGNVNIAGGTISGLAFTNNGNLAGNGAISSTVYNTGDITNTGSGLTFSAVVTNANGGVIVVNSSTGTFSGGLANQLGSTTTINGGTPVGGLLCNAGLLPGNGT